jgi:hypothetical protein
MPQKFHKRLQVGVLFKERRLLLRTQSTVRRLSAETVMLISGPASLDEVARYTKAADQARLARNALAKVIRRTA